MSNLDDSQLKELLLQSWKAQEDYLNGRVTKLEYSPDGVSWCETAYPVFSTNPFYRVKKEKRKFHAGDKIRSKLTNKVFVVVAKDFNDGLHCALMNMETFKISSLNPFKKGNFLTDEYMDDYFSNCGWEVVK